MSDEEARRHESKKLFENELDEMRNTPVRAKGDCPYCGGFTQFFNWKKECRDCGEKICPNLVKNDLGFFCSFDIMLSPDRMLKALAPLKKDVKIICEACNKIRKVI